MFQEASFGIILSQHCERIFYFSHYSTKKQQDYSKRQLKDAQRALCVLEIFFYPLEKYFKIRINVGILKNNPVQVEYLNNPNDIFGVKMQYLRGKTTKTKRGAVRQNIVAVPK